MKCISVPILKNGSRGAPILLKRPKDSTILKVQPGAYKSNTYKRRADGTRVINRENALPRVVRSAVPKQREKLVCPVCGILTYTLGNHMTTHEGNYCSFSYKNNTVFFIIINWSI